MKLYVHPLSGHSHRAVLFFSLIGQPVELIEVDLAKGTHKAPEFLKLNRFGQVPVLIDGDTVISDSTAILVYVAKKFGKSDWLPESPAEAAAVQRWLAVAAGQMAYGPAAARLITVFGAKHNAEEVIARAHDLLKVINDELADHKWITGATPTIADVALYGYIARANEGNVDIAPYANVQKWLNQVESLPGFVPFKKTAAGLAA